MIWFYANSRCASIVKDEDITTGSVGLEVGFSLSAEWEGLAKTAVFRAGDISVDVYLSEDHCAVPPELLTVPEERLTIGLYGTDGNDLVIPTVYAEAGRIVQGAAPSEIEPTPHTASLVDQLLAAAQAARDAADAAEALVQSVRDDADAGAFDGDDGKSAYAIAVENGFIGTEAEWLQSLHGEDAAVDATLSNAGEAADAAATGAVKAMADCHDAELLTITAASSAYRFEWQIGYYWNTSGVSKGGAGFARTHKFVAEPGTLIQNLAEGTVTISGVAKTAQMFVHEFNEATWLRCTKLTQGEYVVVGENTNIVGFVYGFASAQSMTIDQPLINDNFSVRVVRRTAGGASTAKIYCLGDSITKGMYTEIGDNSARDKTDRGWPYWVGLLNNWDVVNLGRSGAGYVKISTDTSESASDVVDNNSFADADYVVLAYGVNDYKASVPATLGSISTSTAGDGTVIGEMMYCIETLGNTKAKNAAIIVMLPMNENRFSNGTLDNNWAFGYAFNDGKTLTDYRDAIRACAEHYNLGVIDPETVCAINRLNIRQCLGDGLHPTKAFYEQMGKTIAACIKAGASAGIFKASGSGTGDYSDLTNKPQINSVTLTGNKSLSDLGIEPEAFVVTITQSGSTYSADKTYSNTAAAISAGKRVVAVLNGYEYQLFSYVPNSYTIVFSANQGKAAKTIAFSLGDAVVIMEDALGTYSKPSGGIPATDLAAAVQISLDKANTALQSVPSTYRTAAAQDVIDAGKADKVTEVTNTSTGDVTLQLDPGKIYHFTGAISSLTLTLATPASGQLAQYHFDFDSGSTAATISISGVTWPGGSFTPEASTHYEVDILNGFGLYIGWEVTP